MKKPLTTVLIALMLAFGVASTTLAIIPQVTYADSTTTIKTGLYKVNGKWRYYENGKFKKSTGLVKRPDNKKWYYVNNGVYSRTTGVVKKVKSDGKWYYVKKGVYTKSTGLAKRLTDKKWVYVKKGLFTKYTGVVKKISNGKTYYVKKGVLDSSKKGTVKQSGLLYTIKDGVATLVKKKWNAWTESAWKTTKEATCKATGTKTRILTRTNNYGEKETKTETQTITKKEHSFGDWVVTTKASCNTEEVKTRTCKTCGHKETKTGTKDHTHHSWTVIARESAQESGDFKICNNISICSSCGAKIIADKGVMETEHDYWNLYHIKLTYVDGNGQSTVMTENSSVNGYIVCGDKVVFRGNHNQPVPTRLSVFDLNKKTTTKVADSTSDFRVIDSKIYYTYFDDNNMYVACCNLDGTGSTILCSVSSDEATNAIGASTSILSMWSCRFTSSYMIMRDASDHSHCIKVSYSDSAITESSESIWTSLGSNYPITETV